MRFLAFSTVALCAGLALVAPAEAQACGGTFCDAGPPDPEPIPDPEPQSMPVEQTGETIVFVIDEDRVEAHIQIQYDPNTEASEFAWVLPISAIPSFEVGSQQLFLNLLNSTVPSYGYIDSLDQCGGGGSGGGGGGGGGWDDGWGDGGGEYCEGHAASSGGITAGSSASDSGWGTSSGGGGTDGWGEEGGDSDTDGGTTGGGADVVAQGTIGAFDMTVISGETSEEILTWLGENGYAKDPNAAPILDEYVEEGFVFAAFKLKQGAEIGEIHPIMVSYEGTEPCVPIRLTAIAAQEDMEIRTFFLSDQRVVPKNYKHVELNPLKMDWFGLGRNYNELVTLAIDEEGSDGHGFVTEFAGSSQFVPATGLYDERWDSDGYDGIAPEAVVDVLEEQGLVSCNAGTCDFLHPLVLGLLQSYLPAPDSVDEGEFYSCLECFEDLIDPKAWDSGGFAHDFRERIVTPGMHAAELLETWSFVTRLYTTLSPHEMTLDPTFMTTDAIWPMPVVDQRNVLAQRNVQCNGRQTYDVPGGWEVEAGFAQSWPDIAPDEMPYALRIESVLPEGPIDVIVNNDALIRELLDAWNGMQAQVEDPPTLATPSQPPLKSSSKQCGGCGCRSDGSNALGASFVLLGLGLGLRWRRRR